LLAVRRRRLWRYLSWFATARPAFAEPCALEGSGAVGGVRRRLLQQRCVVFRAALPGASALSHTRRAILKLWPPAAPSQIVLQQQAKETRMAAMVAPHVDSVQPTAWRAARGRSARGFGQKPTAFEMHLAERAGAPGGRAAQPRWRRRPPTHSQPHGPRKTAHTKDSTRAGARRDSETLSWRRPAAAARGRRGPAAAAVPATRTTR
jgi:hypothetical protein